MMKSLDLQPTESNLLETYVKDSIDRNTALHHFVDFLDALEDSWSIAIDGQWGSGKTFFVKQTKMIFDANNPYTNFCKQDAASQVVEIWKKYHPTEQDRTITPQICIYYDAWAHDSDDDPLFSIIYEIAASMASDYSFKGDVNFWSLFTSIVDHIPGLNTKAILDAIRNTPDPLQQIRENRSTEEKINNFLEQILQEYGDRIIVIVDELDRCNPAYAVRLLERIKHYFAHEHATFVFSINSKELQNTIKQYYGAFFDAGRYLDRFFDYRVSLPPANMNKYYSQIGFNDDLTYYEMAKVVAEHYDFGLREISRYYQLIKTCSKQAVPPKENHFAFAFPDGYGRRFCMQVILPIMIGMNFYDSKMYSDFISGKDGSQLIEIVEKTPFKTWLFENLVAPKETLDSTESGKPHITIENKLKEVYHAVFCKNYSHLDHETKIGEAVFNKQNKELLLKTISTLF